MNDDKDLTDQIGFIAAFIGARLNYVLPRCNSGVRGQKPVSTILVDQHKDKFGFVRVYCELADPDLVQAKWDAEIAVTWKSNTEPPPMPGDFWQKCFRHDAMHYRRVYLDMVALVPHLRDWVCTRADYTELLYDTVEQVDQVLDECVVRYAAQPDVNPLAHYLTRYNVSTVEGLKQAMRTFYGRPSLKDHIGA
jgi:hypothetical protein